MRRHRAHTTRFLVLFAVVASFVSLLFHHTLKADPQGWLQWGHALALGPGDFSTVNYPSWKPLSALLTTPLALTGPAAPDLWLVLMRIGGLMALLLTFRLAFRLGGVLAGVVAVCSLVLVPQFWPTVLGGQIEPTLLALSLLAVERHLAGRPKQALLLGALVALGREEAWPLLLLYALWLFRGERRILVPALAALAVVPALWLGGDWIGSGSALHGGEIAKTAPDALYQRALGSIPGYTLGLVSALLLAPLWCLVAAAIAGALRRGDRFTLALAGATALWIGNDLVVAAMGLPAQERFLIPPAGMLCILAGTGAATLVRLLRGLPEPQATPPLVHAPPPTTGRAGPPLPC